MGDKAEGGLRQFEGVQVRLSQEELSKTAVANGRMYHIFAARWVRMGKCISGMIDGPLSFGEILPFSWAAPRVANAASSRAFCATKNTAAASESAIETSQGTARTPVNITASRDRAGLVLSSCGRG